MEKPENFPAIRQIAVSLGQEGNPTYILEGGGVFPQGSTDYVRHVAKLRDLHMAVDGNKLSIAALPADSIVGGDTVVYRALVGALRPDNYFVVGTLHSPTKLTLTLLRDHKVEFAKALQQELEALKPVADTVLQVKNGWGQIVVTFKGKVSLSSAQKLLNTTSLEGYLALHQP